MLYSYMGILLNNFILKYKFLKIVLYCLVILIILIVSRFMIKFSYDFMLFNYFDM